MFSYTSNVTFPTGSFSKTFSIALQHICDTYIEDQSGGNCIIYTTDRIQIYILYSMTTGGASKEHYLNYKNKMIM